MKFRKQSKYGNRKVTVDGVTFDSKREANRWGELVLLQKAGEIVRLRRQVTFPLVVNGLKVCAYRADFVYHDFRLDRDVVEDAKGFRTPEYELKKKLMKACHGIEIKEV